MQIAYGVTSAPRKISYVGQTLNSLREAGFTDPEVSYDEDKSLGPYGNFKHLLGMLLQRFPDAEALIIFQDDILVASGLFDWAQKNLWPEPKENIGIVSLYCATPNEYGRSGWFKLPLKPDDSDDGMPEICEKARMALIERGMLLPQTGLASVDIVKAARKFDDCVVIAVHTTSPDKWRWFWIREGVDEAGRAWSDMSEMHNWSIAYGACAYAIPAVNARRLIDGCLHPKARSKTDIHAAETCFREGLSYWMRSPSLVQHIGAVSTLHDFGINPFRCSGSFQTSAV